MIRLEETNFGFEFRSEKFVGLFGGKDSSFEKLKNHFADLKFVRVRQTHSDIILESNISSPQVRDSLLRPYQELPEADAHYSAEPQLALCVATADCMPIMIFCHATHRAASIHAGWRGVENRIVPKTIAKLIGGGSVASGLEIIIGPHILKSSFQIQADVQQKLLASSPLASDIASELSERNPDGSFQFDLHQLILLQISEFQVPSENISSLLIDTMTNQNFHSFRRDQQNSGRQISFISVL